jgi:hypothetical protein
VVFKDLGLLIVDEEQKFGVNVKENKTIAANVDTLTLTATDSENFAIFVNGSKRFICDYDATTIDIP